MTMVEARLWSQSAMSRGVSGGGASTRAGSEREQIGRPVCPVQSVQARGTNLWGRR